ncbi:MAG: hypothetical protein KUL88_19025 [Rhizobium sp.]|nr:hypothetical protein [Rhizobium sp.]
MRYFDIATSGHEQLLRARSLGWPDFEDAVIAAAAESAGCAFIVSRNVKDFVDSPVPVLMPEEYLATVDVAGVECGKESKHDRKAR